MFHRGVNLTCRKGTKWSGINGAVLIGTDTKDIAVAQIVGTKTMRMMDVEESDLANEHDPSCRNWNGLRDEMMRVYGNSFDKREIVTLVYFEPIIQYDTADTAP